MLVHSFGTYHGNLIHKSNICNIETEWLLGYSEADAGNMKPSNYTTVTSMIARWPHRWPSTSQDPPEVWERVVAVRSLLLQTIQDNLDKDTQPHTQTGSIRYRKMDDVCQGIGNGKNNHKRPKQAATLFILISRNQ